MLPLVIVTEVIVVVLPLLRNAVVPVEEVVRLTVVEPLVTGLPNVS